jgi:hypothetical protein
MESEGEAVEIDFVITSLTLSLNKSSIIASGEESAFSGIVCGVTELVMEKSIQQIIFFVSGFFMEEESKPDTIRVGLSPCPALRCGHTPFS